MLQAAFDGEPATLGAAVGMMFRLKQQAEDLMQMAAECGGAVGPLFRYVPRSDREALATRTA